MSNNEEIKAGFFIQRPIFATVISIIITLVGLIAIQILPIERYPNLTPPQVSVSASYNGADAETIAQNVASILESQIFGVEDMIYMNSVSSSAGYVNVTVTFAIGTDPDLATINVNNKVQTALARLPTEVQQLGITVTKRNPSMLMLVSLVSTDSSYSKAYLANYASLNVVDELKQVSGVGEVSLFGKDDYSIRIWLDPNKLAYYGLIPADVANVIRSQNAQFAAGSLGAAPIDGKADVYWQVLPPVRYSTPEEFGEIIVRANSDGSTLRLKDVARIDIWLGKLMKMDKDTSLMTATGSAICGAAAVLGAEPVVKCEGHKTAIAVSTVVIFGTISMFLYPIMYRAGMLDALGDTGVAIYTGSTLHEVAHVAGAGNAMDPTDSLGIAGTATITKMIRVMMLAPVLVIMSFALAGRKKANPEGKAEKSKITIPWFAFGFIGIICLNSLLQYLTGAETVKDIPLNGAIEYIDTFMLTMAMTALGTDTSLEKFKQAGAKPFLLAGLLYIWLVGGGYLLTQYITPMFG